MTTLTVEFKVRYIGEPYPTIFEELVDVESDSTEQEEVQQIREHYYHYFITNNSKVAQLYPHTILSR